MTAYICSDILACSAILLKCDNNLSGLYILSLCWLYANTQYSMHINPSIFILSLMIMRTRNIFHMKMSGSFLQLQKHPCHYYVTTLPDNRTISILHTNWHWKSCLNSKWSQIPLVPVFLCSSDHIYLLNFPICSQYLIWANKGKYICLIAFCQKLFFNSLLIESS